MFSKLRVTCRVSPSDHGAIAPRPAWSDHVQPLQCHYNYHLPSLAQRKQTRSTAKSEVHSSLVDKEGGSGVESLPVPCSSESSSSPSLGSSLASSQLSSSSSSQLSSSLSSQVSSPSSSSSLAALSIGWTSAWSSTSCTQSSSLEVSSSPLREGSSLNTSECVSSSLEESVSLQQCDSSSSCLWSTTACASESTLSHETSPVSSSELNPCWSHSLPGLSELKFKSKTSQGLCFSNSSKEIRYCCENLTSGVAANTSSGGNSGKASFEFSTSSSEDPCQSSRNDFFPTTKSVLSRTTTTITQTSNSGNTRLAVYYSLPRSDAVIQSKENVLTQISTCDSLRTSSTRLFVLYVFSPCQKTCPVSKKYLPPECRPRANSLTADCTGECQCPNFQTRVKCLGLDNTILNTEQYLGGISDSVGKFEHRVNTQHKSSSCSTLCHSSHALFNKHDSNDLPNEQKSDASSSFLEHSFAPVTSSRAPQTEYQLPSSICMKDTSAKLVCFSQSSIQSSHCHSFPRHRTVGFRNHLDSSCSIAHSQERWLKSDPQNRSGDRCLACNPGHAWLQCQREDISGDSCLAPAGDSDSDAQVDSLSSSDLDQCEDLQSFELASHPVTPNLPQSATSPANNLSSSPSHEPGHCPTSPALNGGQPLLMSLREFEQLPPFGEEDETELPALWEDGGGVSLSSEDQWAVLTHNGVRILTPQQDLTPLRVHDDFSRLEHRSHLIEQTLSEIYESPFQEIIFAEPNNKPAAQKPQRKMLSFDIPTQDLNPPRRTIPPVSSEAEQGGSSDDEDPKSPSTVRGSGSPVKTGDQDSSMKASIASAASRAVSGYRSCLDADNYVGARARPTLILARGPPSPSGILRRTNKKAAAPKGIQGSVRWADNGRPPSIPPAEDNT